MMSVGGNRKEQRSINYVVLNKLAELFNESKHNELSECFQTENYLNLDENYGLRIALVNLIDELKNKLIEEGPEIYRHSFGIWKRSKFVNILKENDILKIQKNGSFIDNSSLKYYLKHE